MCVCAAVQVAPILRIPPRKPCDLSGASLTTRTRRHHAVSTWHQLAQRYEPAVCASITIQPLRVRRVTARPAEITRDSRSERPLPADLGEPASVPAAPSLCHAYGMHASRRQLQACVGKAAAGGMCSCVALVIVRSDRGHRPERLPLAACSSYLGISCMFADPRAPGCPWATAGATVESHVARLGKFAPPMCSVHSRLGEGMPCDSCG
jgi:hypothetical protein